MANNTEISSVKTRHLTLEYVVSLRIVNKCMRERNQKSFPYAERLMDIEVIHK